MFIYNIYVHVFKYSQTCIERSQENVALWDRWPVKRGSIHMKSSMTGHEKDNLLIQVTA